MKYYKSVIKVFKERWPFILGGYFLGYIVSLNITGVPSVIYLVPVKFLAIMVSVIMSTGVYHATESGQYLKSLSEGAIPLIVILIIFMLVMVIHKSLMRDYGIDISPFVGL